MWKLVVALIMLIPSVAMSQTLTKENMMKEWADIATLIGAEALGCGETDKDRVLAFNSIFDQYFLSIDPDISIEMIEAAKLIVILNQYAYVAGALELHGCEGINKVIDTFDGTMEFADSVYDYYTPLKSI